MAEAVPAMARPATAEKPKQEAAPEKRSDEITPPTSETIARQMKAEGKAGQAAAAAVPEAPKSEAPKSETPKSEAPKPEVAPAPAPAAMEAPKPETSTEQPPHAMQAKPVAEAAPQAAEAPKGDAGARCRRAEEGNHGTCARRGGGQAQRSAEEDDGRGAGG